MQFGSSRIDMSAIRHPEIYRLRAPCNHVMKETEVKEMVKLSKPTQTHPRSSVKWRRGEQLKVDTAGNRTSNQFRLADWETFHESRRETYFDIEVWFRINGTMLSAEIVLEEDGHKSLGREQADLVDFSNWEGRSDRDAVRAQKQAIKMELFGPIKTLANRAIKNMD